jgi:hypothetical protein
MNTYFKYIIASITALGTLTVFGWQLDSCVSRRIEAADKQTLATMKSTQRVDDLRFYRLQVRVLESEIEKCLYDLSIAPDDKFLKDRYERLKRDLERAEQNRNRLLK